MSSKKQSHAAGRARSVWLSQLDAVLTSRGAGALPFKADGDFQATLRVLVYLIEMLEGRGARFRGAGTLTLNEDLLHAFVSLRGDLRRIYEGATQAETRNLASLAQKRVSTIVRALRATWG